MSNQRHTPVFCDAKVELFSHLSKQNDKFITGAAILPAKTEYTEHLKTGFHTTETAH